MNKTQQVFKDLKKKDYAVTLVLGVTPENDIEITPSHSNFAIMSWILDRANFKLNVIQEQIDKQEKSKVETGS